MRRGGDFGTPGAVNREGCYEPRLPDVSLQCSLYDNEMTYQILGQHLRKHKRYCQKIWFRGDFHPKRWENDGIPWEKPWDFIGVGFRVLSFSFNQFFSKNQLKITIWCLGGDFGTPGAVNGGCHEPSLPIMLLKCQLYENEMTFKILGQYLQKHGRYCQKSELGVITTPRDGWNDGIPWEKPWDLIGFEFRVLS